MDGNSQSQFWSIASLFPIVLCEFTIGLFYVRIRPPLNPCHLSLIFLENFSQLRTPAKRYSFFRSWWWMRVLRMYVRMQFGNVYPCSYRPSFSSAIHSAAIEGRLHNRYEIANFSCHGRRGCTDRQPIEPQF